MIRQKVESNYTPTAAPKSIFFLLIITTQKKYSQDSCQTKSYNIFIKKNGQRVVTIREGMAGLRQYLHNRDNNGISLGEAEKMITITMKRSTTTMNEERKKLRTVP